METMENDQKDKGELKAPVGETVDEQPADPPTAARPTAAQSSSPLPSPARPTPVRRSLGVEATDSEGPARTVVVDGKAWRVRVSGASGGGRTHTNVGLVEFEFTPIDGDEAAVVCLTVTHAPEDLSDLQLEELLARHK